MNRTGHALSGAVAGLTVTRCSARLASDLVIEHHYLHRAPPVSAAFALLDGAVPVGAVTFGTPPSRHLQKSACPSDPSLVVELNRLWVADDQPRNTESWFVARALAELSPRIVVSYADTAHWHSGYVYRALNFRYAGWTDMDRKTPRFDYVAASGGHSRDAFRNGYVEKVRRQPKVRYWTVTGNRTQRRHLAALCAWPVMSWHETPPPRPAQ